MSIDETLATLERALTERDLERADAALGALRSEWRAAEADDREVLADRVAPLRARRDLLVAQVGRVAPRDDRLAVPERPIEDALSDLGIGDLRPGQPEAIAAALDGRDCLAVMPTGSGKSLCYMAPALALGGLTLVVSPLIALIADQHQRLVERGAPSVMLAGTLSPEENRDGIARIRSGEARIAFCAPERLGSRELLAACAANRLDLFVVDEAHCVVEWGDDFRPEYMRLAEWRDRLGARATMALTASATLDVGKQIEVALGLRDPERLRLGVDRPNISFEVHTTEGQGSQARRYDTLLAALTAAECLPAIVYTRSRRDAESLAERIGAEGLSTAAYHAGLADGVRRRAQGGFMSGSVEVICATNAFGLGIDKPDIRSVIHWGLPVSIEGYYQEAGRAGRDGLPARAALLASPGDLRLLRHLIDESRIDVASVEATIARISSRADSDGGFVVGRTELERNERMALELDMGARIGALTLRRAPGGGLAGEVRSQAFDEHLRSLATRAARAAESRRWAAYRSIRDFALTPGCPRAKLLRHFDDPASHASEECETGGCNPLPRLEVTVGRRGTKRSAARARPSDSGSADVVLDPEGEALLETLRAWRKTRADGKPAYTVCTDKVLAEVITSHPRNVDSLAEISGVGPAFIERHAEDLLATLGDVRTA